MTQTTTAPEPIRSKWPESPLKPFAGARPPAPPWFDVAIGTAPTRGSFDFRGAAIELLTWGTPGNPGLLFLHGDSAHADWWSFIAPFFADEWHCAAISWSGMGRSGHRPEGYSMENYAAEAIAAIAAAGLDAGGPPIIVAHSMGGVPAMIAACGDVPIRGVVTIDTVILPLELRGAGPTPRADMPHRVHPNLAAALARFRFLPAQPCENLFIVDHFARGGLSHVVTADGGEGWHWAVDPSLWGTLDPFAAPELPSQVRCPLAYLYGEKSSLLGPQALAYGRSLLPPGTPFIGIADAAHHVMADQPLALVTALRTLFAAWPPGNVD